MRIVLAEDDPFDIKLVQSAVRRGDLDVDWLLIDKLEDLRGALCQNVDLVIADFHLVGFTALDIIDQINILAPTVPVIVITGALDDERAAECIKHGAVDYLLKDRMVRIAEAIKAAVKQAAAENAKIIAENQIKLSLSVQKTINAVLRCAQELNSEKHDMTPLLQVIRDSGLCPDVRSISLDCHSLGLYHIDDSIENGQTRGSAQTFRLHDSDAQPSLLIILAAQACGDSVISSMFIEEVTGILSSTLRRIRSELRMRKSLLDQEELVRELHHRVMNNLSIIRVLISLEADDATGEVWTARVSRLETRISALAEIQETLYDFGGYSFIRLFEFIRSLFANQVIKFCTSEPSVRLDCQGDEIVIPLELSTDFALILCDIFTAAFNACAENSAITIKSERMGSDHFILHVSDEIDHRGHESQFSLVKSLLSSKNAQSPNSGLELGESGMKLWIRINTPQDKHRY